MKSLSCPNKHCPPSGKNDVGAIIRHGFYTTRCGKRRRYQCQSCGKTFCSTSGTPYHRLQHRRTTFDEVVALSVEGLNKSAIARAKRITWNTVHRWLARAAGWCRRFSDRKIRRLATAELQADEIRTIVGGRGQPVWVFAVIDVWSRLWPSTVVGKRSYQNTLGDTYAFLSFTNCQARRHTHSFLCSSMGILIEALQYRQYRRLWFVPFLRTSRRISKAAES
jgi:transposase-like protein